MLVCIDLLDKQLNMLMELDPKEDLRGLENLLSAIKAALERHGMCYLESTVNGTCKSWPVVRKAKKKENKGV